MSAVRELPGCRLVRPLLGVPQARLAALLAAERQPFLSDPSNRNPVFERARLRRDSRSWRISSAADAQNCRDYGRQRIARERATRPAAGQRSNPASGRLCRDRSRGNRACRGGAWRPAARPGRCAASAAPRYPLRRERVSRLRAALAGMRRSAPARLAAAVSCHGAGGSSLFANCRAPRRPSASIPGTELFWDRRFGVTAAATTRASKLMLGYLGQSGMRPVRRPSVMAAICRALCIPCCRPCGTKPA